MIALPADTRQRYVHELHARLLSDCRGLLITLEYPQSEKAGPPFSVAESEVSTLYSLDWDVVALERCGILASQTRFIEEGVIALDTVVYSLVRH